MLGPRSDSRGQNRHQRVVLKGAQTNQRIDPSKPRPTPVPQGRRLLAQESMQRIIVLLSIVAQCAAFSTIGRVSSGGSCIDEPDAK